MTSDNIQVQYKINIQWKKCLIREGGTEAQQPA